MDDAEEAYVGGVEGGVGRLWFDDDAGVRHALDHVIVDSPVGLSWGFAGNGPADTARSILAVETGDVATAEPYVKAFTTEVVASLPLNGRFALPRADVRAWLEGHGYDQGRTAERRRPVADAQSEPEALERPAAQLVSRAQARHRYEAFLPPEPMRGIDPRLYEVRNRLGVDGTLRAWDAARVFADRDPQAQDAMTRAEEQLRRLRPARMVGYDEARSLGVAPMAAMQAAFPELRQQALDERERRVTEREARVDALAVAVGLVPEVPQATWLPAEPVRHQLEALAVDSGLDVAEAARANDIDPGWATAVVAGTATRVDLAQVRQVCEGLRCTPYDLWGSAGARSIAYAYGPAQWPAVTEPLLAVDGADGSAVTMEPAPRGIDPWVAAPDATAPDLGRDIDLDPGPMP